MRRFDSVCKALAVYQLILKHLFHKTLPPFD
ncbi:hypothetical protein [Enterococcus phage vB_Efs10_KEN05]